MKTDLFDYDLPGGYIAQKPPAKRDHSKLLVLDKKSKKIGHDFFYNISRYLIPGDVLVVNESRVINCRVHGIKEKTGAKIECFVLENIDGGTKDQYLALIRPFKKLDPGDRVFTGSNYFKVLEKLKDGKAVVQFSAPVDIIFKESGHVPLPPYIKEKNINGSRYQTVYAHKKGSTAAPTAGLHFTKKLIESLKEKGIIFARLGLHIGLDTFKPVTAGEIEDHKMHSEYYYINSSEAKKINDGMQSKRRIIAVGTTSVRALETLMARHGKIMEDHGRTDIFIYPGFKFKAVSALITNFHLPRSTLLMMVSAYAGRENILKSYREAIKNHYRFYSFGDCMLIK